MAGPIPDPKARWRKFLTKEEAAALAGLEQGLARQRQHIGRLSAMRRKIVNDCNQRAQRFAKLYGKSRQPKAEPAWKRWARMAGEDT